MRKIIFAVVLFLSACNAHSNINKVQKGMTAEQVKSVMGAPTNEQNMGEIVWMRYGDNQIVVLENGAVVNVVADVKATTDSMKTILDNK